jgi:hypothetical protein
MGTSLVLRRRNLGRVQPLSRSPSQHIHFRRSPGSSYTRALDTAKNEHGHFSLWKSGHKFSANGDVGELGGNHFPHSAPDEQGKKTTAKKQKRSWFWRRNGEYVTTCD